jgi:hypothetical protein
MMTQKPLSLRQKNLLKSLILAHGDGCASVLLPLELFGLLTRIRVFLPLTPPLLVR